MAVVGIRSRDQIWQLLLVGVTTSLLLVAIGATVLTRGGDDNTSAEGLDADGQRLNAVAAGPSDADDAADDDGIGRSGGPLDSDLDSDSDSDSEEDSESTLKVTSTVVSTTSGAVETTLAESTTTDPPTTVESSTTTVPSTTVPETTTSTTKPDVTSTLITSPTTVLQNHNVTPKDLAAARKLWSKTGYDSYQMTVTRWCFCAPDYVGPFEVTVRRGDVTVRHLLLEDGRVADWLDPHSLTAPGLFNLIESSFDAEMLNVVFDKNTGIPLTISIDSSRFIADDELTVEVKDFRPLR